MTAGAVDFSLSRRCGFEVPGWHKPCHLDDAKLPDGTPDIDVAGRSGTAQGITTKLVYGTGDGGVALALLSAYRANPRVFANHDRDHDSIPDVLDEARWVRIT